MSKLCFAPLNQAFILGSDTIKDTNAEIEKLKNRIGDVAIVKKKESEPKAEGLENQSPLKIEKLSEKNKSENNDLDLLKVMQDPNFDNLVKTYIMIKNPEWIKKPEKEKPEKENSEKENNKISFSKENFGKENFGKENFGKENFGKENSCNNILYFLIISFIFYLFLEKILKK